MQPYPTPPCLPQPPTPLLCKIPSGLGAEVAKNVILAGVRSVTLHDDRPCSLEDMSSQFCLRAEEAEEAVEGKGKRKAVGRARASVKLLRELNPYVDVRLLEVWVWVWAWAWGAVEAVDWKYAVHQVQPADGKCRSSSSRRLLLYVDTFIPP